MNNLHALRCPTKIYHRYKDGLLKKVIVLDSKHPVENTIDMTVRDKNGNITEQLTYSAKSLTQHFLNCLFDNLRNTNIAMSRLDGGSPVSDSGVKFRMDTNSTTRARGIYVGTGTAAVSLTDNTLPGIISHGTSAGQLSYGNTSFNTPVLESNIWRFSIDRAFTNNSGATVTIRNVGLACSGSLATPTFLQCWLLGRDKILKNLSEINVALTNGSSVSFRYNLYFSANEGVLKALVWFIYSRAINSNQNTLDVDGDSVACNVSARGNWSVIGAANDDSVGIVVGSGSGAVSGNDFKLGEKIFHGTGSGQLSYAVTNSAAPVISGNNITGFVSRLVTNNSSGNIYVRELGIQILNDNIARRMLIFRKLTGDLLLQPEESYEIYQNFEINV